MKIGELSKLTQVSTRSIRHYEEKGLLEAVRSDNGYREFDLSAVERIQIIQLYLTLGFTTEEIRSLFEGEVASPDDYEYCNEMVAMYEEKLSRADRQIERLQELKRMLEKQIASTMARR